MCFGHGQLYYLDKFIDILDFLMPQNYYIATSMLRKLAIYISVLGFAFGILLISVLRTASVKYEFSELHAAKVQDEKVLGEDTVIIDYYLAFPGKVLPDNPLWPVKALRDRIWLWITTNPSRKAELNLLFADKRVAASKLLFERDKPEIGYSTLTKAEKYLWQASVQEKKNRKEGLDTGEFLSRLAKASLKHALVMDEIMDFAPEDAKPGVIQTMDSAKKVYEGAKNGLLEKGLPIPENPFDWK